MIRAARDRALLLMESTKVNEDFFRTEVHEELMIHLLSDLQIRYVFEIGQMHFRCARKRGSLFVYSNVTAINVMPSKRNTKTH